MSIDETLAAYVQSWGTPDEGDRRALLESAWAESGIYQDPTGEARGREALVQHIGGFHKQMPGARIELTSGISHHHDQIYFAWRLRGGDGATIVEGVDFGEMDAQGKIARITGFFGAPGD